MKRAVICARVSTDTQADTTRGIPSQLADMRRYCVDNAMDVVAEVADDISGTTPMRERPGGAELYRLIDARAVDAVVFHTVDRIARDEDLVELPLLRRDIRQAGLELHYAQGGGLADLSTLGGMIDALRAGIAAEERKKIIERGIRGRRAKAHAGRWVGQGGAPFGYRREGSRGDSRLIIDPIEADAVRRIFGLFTGADGRPPMPIRPMTTLLTAEGVPTPNARNTGRKNRGWHAQTVHMILTRRLYVGELVYRDIVTPAPELAIITPELFEDAQARLRRNRATAKRNRRRHYLLAGHLRCECGRAMTGRGKREGYTYYVCSGRSLPAHLCDCDARIVNARTLDAIVWDWLATLITDGDALAAALDRLAERQAQGIAPRRAQAAAVSAEVDRLERRITVWVNAYADAGADELHALKAQVKAASAQLAERRAERDRLQAEIHQAELSPARRADALRTIAALQAFIVDADADARRYIAERLDVRVRLTRDGVTRAADVSIGVLGAATSPERFPVVSSSPRIALPATRARRCDTPLAPKNPACPPR